MACDGERNTRVSLINLMKSNRLVIMWKYGYIKVLISLLLIPSFLIGCGLETGDSQASNELTENLSNPNGQNSQNLEKSFKDIQETYKQFQKLLEIFLIEIDAVRSKLKNQESVNSNKVNQKLEEIEVKINQYRNNLQTKDAQVLELFDDINLIVNKIKLITEQLKEELGKETIGKVQIHLGDLVSGPKDKYYGVLGPGTTKAIKKSLRENSQQLKDKLTQLPKTTSLVRELASTKTIEALSTKVTILETEVRELRNQTKNNTEGEIATISERLTNAENQLEQTNARIVMMLIFSLVALGLAVVSTSLSLYKLFGKTGINKQVPGSGSEKKHDPAIQVDYTKESVSLVEPKQKSGNFGMYDNKINQSNKNTSQLEQNKGVNIQQNPVQSNMTTPRAKSGDQSVTKRQHQQTYSLGYSSSSGSELMPASNNSPQSFSDNRTPLKKTKQSTQSFSDNGTPVAETKQSIEQRRLGGNKAIVFEKNRRGNYSIFKEAAVEYMIPKSKLKINEFNRETVEVLFECQGYQPEYSGFQLIKPARVSAISKGETWQLVERGILQFY